MAYKETDENNYISNTKHKVTTSSNALGINTSSDRLEDRLTDRLNESINITFSPS